MSPRIELPGGFAVDADPVADIVSRGTELLLAQRGQIPAGVITALHVGGLRSGADAEFRTALERADLVCADGAAVVSLSRLAGVRKAERAPTTDVGLAILASAARRRPDLRIALIGGQGDISERAGQRLAAATGASVVFCTHGYHDSWETVVSSVREARPDVTVLGLGSPFETKWAEQRRGDLPGVILTCGGWFGFLVGEERRAPKVLQNIGLEWTWRLAQAPRRLLGRYAAGSAITLGMALYILGRRFAR